MPPIRSPWTKIGLQNNKNNRKSTYIYKLKNTLHILKINENEVTTHPNLWDTIKAVLEVKSIASSDSEKKLERENTLAD